MQGEVPTTGYTIPLPNQARRQARRLRSRNARIVDRSCVVLIILLTGGVVAIMVARAAGYPLEPLPLLPDSIAYNVSGYDLGFLMFVAAGVLMFSYLAAHNRIPDEYYEYPIAEITSNEHTVEVVPGRSATLNHPPDCDGTCAPMSYLVIPDNHYLTGILAGTYIVTMGEAQDSAEDHVLVVLRPV